MLYSGFYFRIVNDTVSSISGDLTDEQHRDPSWISRHDITSFEHATQIATQANAMLGAGTVLIPIDSGEGCWPRYDVVQAPKVGEEISRALNGDYYPDGEIVKISGKDHRIVTTSTGRKYYRRHQSSVWIADKHYSMVRGHISRLNPEF
jgi:hypothetical protein